MASASPERDTRQKAPVGAPHSAAEREADRVADALTATPAAGPIRCAACAGGDSPCPACSASTGHLRRRAKPQAATPAGPTPAADAVLARPAAQLPDGLRQRFERRLGADLSSVRLHTGPDATRAADSLDAHAFALGPHIVVGERQYQPHTPSGEHLLAHEVAHVLQDEATPVLRRNDGAGPAPTTPTPAPAPTPTAGGTPVLWGLDMAEGRRTIYASVRIPGHTLAEVASYIYGSADQAEALSSGNGGLPEHLPAGRALRLTGGTLSEQAVGDINRGIEQGTIMRSEGIPTESAERTTVYRFSADGRSFEVTETQYVGMMQGSVVWLQRKARFLRDSANDGRWVHNRHIEGTNSLVRGIADWMGDTECPPLSMWNAPRDDAQTIVDALDGYHATTTSGALLRRQLDTLTRAATALDEAENTWRSYINATIEGAETTVHRLEIVRNVSFGVAAGLAGAIAAPVVFAAAPALFATVGAGGLVTTAGTLTTAGTVVASSLAIAGGAGAGAVTQGTLEFTGAVGGEGISMAITPGAQSFDWGYVGERTTEGIKSGAIQGGIGAASALVAPGIASAVSTRMFGCGMGTLTTGQRLIVNAISGGVIGMPSGAIGAAIESLDDVAAGRMSLSDYLISIGLGSAMGLGLGVGLSWLPINGLYRSGGRPGVPFSGEPVTPRWMLSGPFSQFQTNFTAPPDFHNLPANELPPLRQGYQWARLNNQWEPISTTGPMRDPVQVTIYGPDPSGRFNYVVRQGEQIIGSRAFTRPRGGGFTGAPGAGRNNYPMTVADYTDPVTGQSYIRGHNIDFADTINTPGTLSTMDPVNYTPEQADWGLHMRRILVGDIRAASGAQGQYRQMEFFEPNTLPRYTANGRRIPDGVYFAEYNSATGEPVRAWQVRWADAVGLRTRVDSNRFLIPPDQLPPILRWGPASPAVATGGSVSAAAARSDEAPR